MKTDTKTFVSTISLQLRVFNTCCPAKLVRMFSKMNVSSADIHSLFIC